MAKGSLKAKYKNDSMTLRKLLGLVQQNCLDCAGGTREEAKFCSVLDCPLWEWRLGVPPTEVNKALIDKKNFVEGAMFGFDKEASESEKAFRELVAE